jgi:hypothetical protein
LTIPLLCDACDEEQLGLQSPALLGFGEEKGVVVAMGSVEHVASAMSTGVGDIPAKQT